MLHVNLPPLVQLMDRQKRRDTECPLPPPPKRNRPSQWYWLGRSFWFGLWVSLLSKRCGGCLFHSSLGNSSQATLL